MEGERETSGEERERGHVVYPPCLRGRWRKGVMVVIAMQGCTRSKGAVWEFLPFLKAERYEIHVHTTFCLSIHPSIAIQVVSTFWLL